MEKTFQQVLVISKFEYLTIRADKDTVELVCLLMYLYLDPHLA